MSSKNEVELKINIIGPLGTGKTSLLNQYVHKCFKNDYQNTLGAQLISKTIKLDKTCMKLQIWDTGGQERFRSLVSTFYKGSDGCFLVYDVTDEDTFVCLEQWRKDFLSKLHAPVTDFPIIVLGNKVDLTERKVSKESAVSWCNQRSISYFEVSAKLNINVELAFETLAKKALLHYWEARESYLVDSIKLTPVDDSPHGSCC
ncbi:ras-related protein Rab-7b [Pelobates fuscus]|uniref:ras-related protein Rab-7b n=1 Tax=Pelobates fuscus TaxID=191477 RepID=UPI002FE4D948